MTGVRLYQGRNPLRADALTVAGRWVTLEGEKFYQMANYDRLRPFFMTVVSNADHWLFISSNGGLTAGRRDANLALFPYYTDDKIRDLAEVTGSKTLIRLRRRDRELLWEPFSSRANGIYRVRRNLYKNYSGNKLVFEEVNEDLALTFRYAWCNSERFGFVRRAWLENRGSQPTSLRLLDGVQNLMPTGTGSQFNLEYSTLLDAYKRNELLPGEGLGLFRLSAIPVDRPEPAEALRTTVAWSLGLKREVTLLSATQLDHFREGHVLRTETDVRAERGAYLVQSKVQLRPRQRAEWMLVADVNQGPSEVVKLQQQLHRPASLQKMVLRDIEHGTEELRRIVARADGLQQTAHPLRCARHYSNTLFNVMRGGIFADGYQVDARDLSAFVNNANPEIARQHRGFLRRLPKRVRYRELVGRANKLGDPQLERICREYLPLTFSRRHGDPSRPWNRFSITTRNAEGLPSLNYEGNWRDIFQNWEALALSFPDYLPGMICRFLNASTADGYNPYRISRHGIDWEVANPHDPWSFIGYWGDHQIIYLLRLLEHFEQHEPGELRALLGRKIFAYANVPYRIKPYQDLLANPKDTVVFDRQLDELIRRRVHSRGADGKLLWDTDGKVGLVNLAEKLLVPLLAKLSNFVPGAGIWLNTQRPEWNDANNALVGNGCSMVTLYYLRRYLKFCQQLWVSAGVNSIKVSSGVAMFLSGVKTVLERHRSLLGGQLSDAQRKRVVDELGDIGSRYRSRLYETGWLGRFKKISRRSVLEFLNRALDWVNHTIQANRRNDSLYHAYNLVRFDQQHRLPIRRLYEMLEGQVAVLSSGQLSAEASLRLLSALRNSAMFRPDQRSYLLYPNRQLPRFIELNKIPPREVRRSALLQRLLADGNRQLIERDAVGGIHFHSAITNARDAGRILEQLATTRYRNLVHREAALVLGIFERLFDHESFTGRSGTFFGYEGLGCIYWHMVSKLLLAVQETFFRAVDSGTPANVVRKLADRYYDIRAGIGDSKTPAVYGAFPMDPYSHTPGQGGARQPGLTGQVKEDFLCRFGELGVQVEQGRVKFRPFLLRPDEFATTPGEFTYYDVVGNKCRISLKPGELAFTFCQVPVIYRLAPRNSMRIVRLDGTKALSRDQILDADLSKSLFGRAHVLKRIEVQVQLPSLESVPA